MPFYQTGSTDYLKFTVKLIGSYLYLNLTNIVNTFVNSALQTFDQLIFKCIYLLQIVTLAVTRSVRKMRQRTVSMKQPTRLCVSGILMHLPY